MKKWQRKEEKKIAKYHRRMFALIAKLRNINLLTVEEARKITQLEEKKETSTNE